MYQINCENPTIILHPYAKELIPTYGRILWYGVEKQFSSSERYSMRIDFDYKRFSAKRNGITLEMLDNFGIITPDGEILPLYIAVPCNKCVLCREKKRNEWACRAICENQSSSNVPFFLTLTYAPENLPSDGVCKKDCQDFMKRLRINLERAGYDNKIRYFLVSEYGKNTHRAHYHAIIWNFPKMKNITACLHFIEKAWDLGFCYVRTCDDGAVYYTMKYMRKQCVVPKGQNDVFFLSSRRGGGIGSQYCDTVLKPLFLENPELLTFKVTDKFSGKVSEFSLPAYFVGRLFPTRGRLLAKEFRDAFESLLYNYTYLYTQCGYYKNRYPIEYYLDDLQKEFPYMRFYNPFTMAEPIKVTRFVGLFPETQEIIEDVDIPFLPYVLSVVDKTERFAPDGLAINTQDFRNAMKRIDDALKVMRSYNYDAGEICAYLQTLQVHKDAVAAYAASRPAENVADKAYNLRQKLEKQASKEIL